MGTRGGSAGDRAGLWMKAAALWGPVLLYMAGITYLSHQPNLHVPGFLPDWLLHGVEYAGLGAILVRALAGGERRVTRKTGILAVAAAMAFGCLDEFHQSFVPGREASMKDVFADGAGALLAASIARIGWPGESKTRPRIEITLYGRAECHLCDEAEEAIRLAGRQFPVSLRKVDIEQDPDLARAYSEQVPVVIINGRKWSKLKLDPERLHKKLHSISKGPDHA